MKPMCVLEPEVPGGLGPRTQMDRSLHPPKITYFHFIFDGWQGDQIVESFPGYLITASLAVSLERADVSGFELDVAQIETSEQFRELYPELELPQFRWLKVVGKRDNSDLFITSDHRLAVSKKVLDLVLATNPKSLEYYALKEN